MLVALAKDVNLGVHAIQEVQQALTRLEQHSGRLNSREIWYQEEDNESQAAEDEVPAYQDGANNRGKFDGSLDRLAQMKSDLRRLKEVHATLNCLLASTSKEISLLQTRLNPVSFHHGITSISDELLAFIFEYVCGASDIESSTPVVLSHVCRRFRAVVLALPSVWAKISNRLHSAAIKEYIRRSDEVGLDLRMVPYPRHGSFPHSTFLRAASALSDRWEEFTFTSANELEMEIALGATNFYCTDFHLPRLQTLTMVYPEPRFFDAGMDNNDIHFYSSWTMPNLTTLSATNIILRPLPGASLRFCNLTFSNIIAHTWDMRRILLFLAELQGMEHLSLSFTNAVPTTISLPRTQIVNLQSLHLRVSGRTSNSMVRQLMYALRMPRLTDLTVTINLHPGHDLRDWMLCLFPWDNPYYYSLTSFNLTVLKEDYSNYPLDLVFYKMRYVQNLSVCAPDIPPPSNLPVAGFPNLRNVTFRRCHKFDEAFIRKLLRKVQRFTTGDQSFQVNVTECPSIDRRALEAEFPRTRFWSSID